MARSFPMILPNGKVTNTKAMSEELTDIALSSINIDRDIQLSSTGGLSIGNNTAMIEKFIMQIGTNWDPVFSLTKYFPDATYPTEKIFVEVADPIAGMTAEYGFGEPVPEVKKINVHAYEMTPASFREQAIINEKDILFIRERGSKDPAVRGLFQRLFLESLNLYARMQVRKKYLISKAVYEGQITYKNKVISYGIPSANIMPVTAAWATLVNGKYLINDSAKPMDDIYYALTSYQPFQIRNAYTRELIMNPTTARWLMGNANTKDFIKYAFNNSSIFNDAKSFSSQSQLNSSAFQYVIPELGVKIVVDSQVKMNEDSLGNPLTTSTEYIIPDGKILVAVDPVGYGGPLGEFAMTLAVQNGGFANPEAGMYLSVEDNTAPGSRGGLTNPFINLVAGFNGLPKIDRPFDIQIIDVLAVAA